MDGLSRIVAWFSHHEAGIGAVIGATVLAGILFGRTCSLLGRRAETAAEKPPGGGAGETSSAAASSARKLVVSAVDPGFVKWLPLHGAENVLRACPLPVRLPQVRLGVYQRVSEARPSSRRAFPRRIASRISVRSRVTRSTFARVAARW